MIKVLHLKFLAKIFILILFCFSDIQGKNYTDFTLEEVQRIGTRVPNGIPKLIKRPNPFNCDSWQNDFINELLAYDIPHTKCKLKLRPKDNPGPTVMEPEIRFNNIMVGFDTHFYTKIKIGEDMYIFDNFNINGMKEEDHKSRRTYWYSPSGEENTLIQVPEKDNVKFSCVKWSPKLLFLE